MASKIWSFWIDRGGTFTDCIARAPDGRLTTRKLLSSDTAILQAIQSTLKDEAEWRNGDDLPPCSVRIGTTLATNALLERRGADSAFATTRGFGDLLDIGTQQRPDLFALDIKKPPPLYSAVLELPGRIGADGSELEPFDENAVRAKLKSAYAAGLRSLAIAGVHAYFDSSWEEQIAAIAQSIGFEYVALSSKTAREIGLLARAETTLIDAYLTPLLHAHIEQLGKHLPKASLRFMQSSGGLTDATRFRGQSALLSGPAGGAIGAARVAKEAGYNRAIGFDMGGTSTDVSLLVDGKADRVFEVTISGAHVRTPMLHIHTVAAGGGSLCRFDGFQFSVGPQSAGVTPGPLCYGNSAATELTLTDVNQFLGRLRPERFPLQLHAEPVRRAVNKLCQGLQKHGLKRTPDEVAAGFVEIANANMAQAISKVSIERGVDPRDFVLVGFGGAAGQHVCAVARRLGVKKILLHPLAGLLSAYGIGIAELTWDKQQDVGRVPLLKNGQAPNNCLQMLNKLEEQARSELIAEGGAPASLQVDRYLDMRYVGSETFLNIAEPANGNWHGAFLEAHRTRFGYLRKNRAVEVVNARVQGRAVTTEQAGGNITAHNQPDFAENVTTPQPHLWDSIWFPELGRTKTPIYERETLKLGTMVEGPALILEESSTVLVDPGFVAEVNRQNVLILSDTVSNEPPKQTQNIAVSEADPVRLEVLGNRFMSIAEQMGVVLQKTAISTNIKDRLDYSCAIFNHKGDLIANAPHIPVHLGAMGATVRSVLKLIPDLRAGDTIITNDPAKGGSHLPDITLVTPVFVDDSIRFFVACRGHQEDIGGITPGSMPAHARNITEEGVVLQPFPLLRDGVFDERRLRHELTSAPWPARNPDDNVADMEAMLAANHAGETLLRQMESEIGRETIKITIKQLQDAARAKVEREIMKLGDGKYQFADQFDDGTPISVCLTIKSGWMTIDFSGTGAAQTDSNLNAPRAVVESAIIYVLRCLVNEKIPLNSGSLAPVTINTPAGSLLNPPPDVAVCGGNVETSQRIVEVLFGALKRIAAGQGTMNNLTFGDEHFGYYETIGGGAGAGPGFNGASGVHTHMTNTRITDVEVMEARMPVIIRRFALRPNSGGQGKWRGGNGLVRELEFTKSLDVSLLTERRRVEPWGMNGGAPGLRGCNTLIRSDGNSEQLAHRASVKLKRGDRILIETPGGGGFEKHNKLKINNGHTNE